MYFSLQYLFQMPFIPSNPLGDITNTNVQQEGQEEEIPMDAEDAQNQQPAQAKARADVDPTLLKMSKEEFLRLSDMIVVHVRSEEERHGEDEEWKGVKQSELVEWFDFVLII